MAQKVVETIGFIIYLATMIGMSYYILNHHNGWAHYRIMGLTGIFLALGPGAEMLTRIFALMTNGIVEHLTVIGRGRQLMWMSLYIIGILLYEMIREATRRRRNKSLDRLMYGMALLGILMSLFRANQWDALFPVKGMGFLRLLPLMVLYVFLAMIFYGEGTRSNQTIYMHMSLAIIIILVTSLINTFWGGSIVNFNFWQIVRTLAFGALLVLPFLQVRHDNLLSRF